MKMAKKFLAIALAGVLALSVLTGCGDSANTKSIAEAMSDMVKAGGITVKEKSELNTKAKKVVEVLAEAEELAYNVTAEPDEGLDSQETFMGIMGPSYSNQLVWVSVTETKGYNATAQAANLLHGRKGVHGPVGLRLPAGTCYIGTTTFTKNGTTYRFAVFTAAPKAEQTPAGGGNVKKK